MSHRNLRSWGARVAGACLSGAMLFSGVGASAQSLESVTGRVGGLEGQLGQLRGSFLSGVQRVRTRTWAEAISDGNLRYRLGEWEAASILYTVVVDNPQAEGQPGYNDARFRLADSLFRSRNFVLARSWFEKVVQDNDPEYSLRAAGRLLEIAFAQGRFDGLDSLFAQLQRGRGGSVPEVSYVRGRALYLQGRYRESTDAYAEIPQNAPDQLHLRSRYLIAVNHVQQGDFERAFSELDAVIAAIGDPKKASDVERDLVELCVLARGRIFYEQGKWADAADAYSRIPRTSPRFTTALYEAAWTLIREERYVDAIQYLDFLVLLADDNRLGPESELLRGDLYLRLNDYVRSERSFRNVANTFEPLVAEMRMIAEQPRDTRAFFRALVDDEGDLSLPPVAASYFERDRTYARAWDLVSDLDGLEATVDTIRGVIGELDVAINSPGRANVFPTLREAWARSVELELAVIDARAQLVEVERAASAPSLSAADQAEYGRLRAARQGVESTWQKLPRTFDAMAARANERAAELDRLVLDAYRSEQSLELARERAQEVRRTLEEQDRAGQLAPERAQTFRAELDAELKAIEAQKRESRRLREQFRLQKLRIGVDDDQARQDAALRAEYDAALRAEAAFLRSRRASGAVDWARIDALHGRLDVVGQGVTDARSEIDRIVGESTADARAVLEEERARLAEYEAILARYQGQGMSVAGDAAYQSFLSVMDRMNELTLRSNLGVLDIAWRLKENVTREIEARFGERNRRLKVLDADFSELMKQN